MQLARLLRSVARIEGSWRTSDHRQALVELGEVLKALYQLELEAEQIEDSLIREHIFDRLETLAARRRSAAEEIRWALASAKNSE